VLVLAVAGGAWALFGRDTTKKSEVVAGPKAVSTSAPARPAGPVAPGTTPKARTSPTATAPAAAAATQPAATKSPAPAPSKAPVKVTPSPSAAPVSKPPVTTPPAAKPPVTTPQVGGTVAAKAYTFRVARGDTLWDLTKQVLRSTGRSTSNASVDAFVQKLYSANKATIGANPDLILVGSSITWPAGL
jgi:nucleoid-associated protein YgaU